MVDFEGYQDVKAGLKTETQVKEITEGTQEQFRTANYFDSFQDKTKIEVAKKQNTAIVITKVFLTFTTKRSNKISNLYFSCHGFVETLLECLGFYFVE